MRKLIVFNNVSLDGYFTDDKGDMSWAHKSDPEWNEFAAGNAKGGGVLVFGRVTFQMMESFWPSDMAKQMFPDVAKGMNDAQKVVFSRSLKDVKWNNTKLFNGNLIEQIKKMKAEDGPGLAILGSGTIVSQLAEENLIDEYQVVITPVALGKGRTLFEGMKHKLNLKLASTRVFKNGNVLLNYLSEP